jgi:uncharacterized protein YlxW (UPF0749 family)
MPEPEDAGTPIATRAAAASPTPDEGPGTVGWREMLRDFLKPGRAQVIFAAILLICGLAVAMQVRTQRDETDYSSLRRADLVQMLDDLTAESRRLEAEIAELEDTRQRLQSGADTQKVAREEAQRRLDVLSILGGTVPAQGRGVRITINDPQAKVTPEVLLNAVEEMRDAGAEVIAINNSIRVVASTWFGTAASGLVVDGSVVTRPIVIEVIGDPHALTEAARFRGGLVSEVQGPRVGGEVSITTEERLVIQAVLRPRPNQFAKPA